MKFDISEYHGRYAMHCSTREDAETFLNFLQNIGKRWCDGTKYSHTNYESYEERTAYAFNEGKFGTDSWYKEHSYTVLEFEDFDWDDDFTPLSNRDLKRIDNFFSQFVIK